MPPYLVYTVAPAAPESSEPAGTKAQFWFERDGDGAQWLFKKARDGSSEDCSEVVCAELAESVGLPHALYELATFEDARGVISRNFVSPGQSLLLGNDVLSRHIPDYPPAPVGPRGRLVLVPDYTIANVLAAIESHQVGPTHGFAPLASIASGYDLFVGYLMFDVLISNTDRHHRNWGFIREGDETTLAPTFDHGSSLGRELLDRKQEMLLTEGRVKEYAERGASRFAGDGEKPITMMQAFEAAVQTRVEAAKAWVERLDAIGDPRDVLKRLPDERMSNVGRDFTTELLRINRERITVAMKGL